MHPITAVCVLAKALCSPVGLPRGAGRVICCHSNADHEAEAVPHATASSAHLSSGLAKGLTNP